MVRWWWFGPAVEKPEILRELQQMKADGIGGAELAFVYAEELDDPARNLKNLPFLSPEMLSAVTYAQAEGRKLGLRIDVTLCSGWPYGGPATTLDQAATRLRTMEVAIPPGTTGLPKFKLPDGEAILSISVVNGEPKHWDAASAVPFQPTAANTIPPASIPRTALFFIASKTKQQVKRAALGAEGYVLDPFSHDAVANHLKSVGEPLVKAFGSTPPYAIFSDSLEAYGADWTPALPAEFLKRRGYDLLPHLPELVAGGTPAAEQVRHDWGQTLTELVNQNYLTQINNWAIAHHTKFRSQTYGEPAVNFSSQRLVSLPEGEGPQWRQFSTLRWASSGNHVFGNNVTSGETFTWLHSPVFRATPLDMKAEADVDFIMGENQLIFHGWPYSPPQATIQPGWSLYAAAVFNDHNPWHPVMPEVTAYITRISALLRQGHPANQVAILLPTDDAWAHFAPGKATATGELARLVSPELISTILSAGYNFDFIDAEAIDKGGLDNYQILVVPPTDRIPAETLSTIVAWSARAYVSHLVVQRDHTIIAVGRRPTMDSDGKTSIEIDKFSKFIPLVANMDELREALGKAAKPDFLASLNHDQLGFIRRHLPASDIYFVANTSNHPVDTAATFTTSHRFAQQIDPDSTISTPASAIAQPIHLAPFESRIFIFSDTPTTTKPLPPAAPATQLADLSTHWKINFTSTKQQISAPTLTDWAASPATRNYSGEAVYTRDFPLSAAPTAPTWLEIEGGTPLVRPGSEPLAETNTVRPAGAPLPNPLVTRTGPGMRAWYDPPVREAALVFINGQKAGALWHPPYRLDVTPYLKVGQNHIEIRVYNTALNAWAALPPHDYKPLIAKYGDRFQMQDLNKVEPIPSGILGKIHLVQASK